MPDITQENFIGQPLNTTQNGSGESSEGSSGDKEYSYHSMPKTFEDVFLH